MTRRIEYIKTELNRIKAIVENITAEMNVLENEISTHAASQSRQTNNTTRRANNVRTTSTTNTIRLEWNDPYYIASESNYKVNMDFVDVDYNSVPDRKNAHFVVIYITRPINSIQMYHYEILSENNGSLKLVRHNLRSPRLTDNVYNMSSYRYITLVADEGKNFWEANELTCILEQAGGGTKRGKPRSTNRKTVTVK